jgi:hypothetical protein
MRKKFTAVLALWTTGCVSWQTQRAPLPQDPNNTGSQKVLVELRSGTRLTLYEVRVLGDSLVGMSAPASAPSRGRVAFATSDVQRVSTKHFSVGRTVAAVVTIGIAALVIAGASSAPASSSSNSGCESAATPTRAPTA